MPGADDEQRMVGSGEPNRSLGVDFFGDSFSSQGFSQKGPFQHFKYPMGIDFCCHFFNMDNRDDTGLINGVLMRVLYLRIIVCCLLISGCSVINREPFPLIDPALHKVWPTPPETARIKLLRVISGPDTILPTRDKFQLLFESITGEQQAYIGFSTPAGIAVDGERFIYVADPTARLVHRYDLVEREVGYLTLPGGLSFASPVGVAVDQNGTCYVSDSVLGKVFKFDKDAEFVGILGNEKLDFQRPAGIAVAKSGKKYVVDVLAHKLMVFDSNDSYLGSIPASGELNELERPISVAVDQKGHVYVTDALSFSIKVFDDAGMLVKTIGQVGDSPGSFARPKGVALDSDGNIYTVDANFDNFQIFDQQGQFLMYVGRTGMNPGEFYLPNGIFIDQKDRIYVSDSYNRRIQIFQYLKENDKKN